MTDSLHSPNISPQMLSHQPVFDLAEVYDIAFDFRDLPAQCDALDTICERFRGGKPASFADLACGPGYHCIEYAKRGRRSYALDLNPAMVEYACRKAKSAGTLVQGVTADMRDFALEEPVDLAFCAMASFHYLLTDDDIVRHLRAVAKNLTPEGLYVVEANHPRDAFRVGHSLKNVWEAQRGGTVVRSSWGSDADPFDPITQIMEGHVRMEVERGGHTETYEFTTKDRSLTYSEFQLLIEKAGVFDAATWLGVLDVKRPFDNSTQSLRMMPVLRKRNQIRLAL